MGLRSGAWSHSPPGVDGLCALRTVRVELWASARLCITLGHFLQRLPPQMLSRRLNAGVPLVTVGGMWRHCHPGGPHQPDHAHSVWRCSARDVESGTCGQTLPR
jgi:hypothetical protein